MKTLREPRWRLSHKYESFLLEFEDLLGEEMGMGTSCGVEVRGLVCKGEVCAIVEGECLWRGRFTTIVTDEGAGVGKGIFL